MDVRDFNICIHKPFGYTHIYTSFGSPLTQHLTQGPSLISDNAVICHPSIQKMKNMKSD